MAANRGKDWLAQANEDFKWLRDTLQGGYYSQACFIAQQVAEKALKALAFHRGADQVRGHSVVEIARALQENGEVETAGKILDQYYISARYPDALPSGYPSDMFTREQAESAANKAEFILKRVIDEFGQSG